MADNYCQFSAWMDIPVDKIKKAETIIAKTRGKIEKRDEYCGCVSDLKIDEEDKGVWFNDDDGCGNPDHVEEIAKALVDGLKIDKPFFCSWANTCSSPRVDEFGGGAFVLRRGIGTCWVDAMDMVKSHIVS